MSSDWAQNRAIRDLKDEVSAQAAAATARQSAVERRLRALQGDLSTKVSTLTFQLNSLIELGDIRDELTLYIPTRRARDAAVDLTRAVLRGDGDLTFLRQSPDLAADGDYWLVPAALAIVDARQGVLDADAAATALRLDRGRAAPFLVAVTALVGHPDLTAAILPDCFLALASADARSAASPFGTAEPADGAAQTQPTQAWRYGSAEGPAAQPSPPVTNAERTLWRATSSGLLGNEAVPTVRRALEARLAAADSSAWTSPVADPLREAPRLGHLASEPDPLARIGDGSDTRRTGSSPMSASTTPSTHSREAVLGAWSLWADRIGEHELRGNRAVGEADLASAPAGSPVADLERTVMSLVREGGPRERELLERADLLSSHLGKTVDREPQWWSGAHTGVVELVVADAKDGDVDTAALVAPLVAPALLQAADAHRDQLLTSAAPTASVRLVSTPPVTVTPVDDGAQEAERARAAYLGQPMPQPRWWLTGGLAAVALLFAVLGLVQQNAGWWIGAALLLAVAVGTYVAPMRKAREERQTREFTVARFDRALDEAREKVRTEAAALKASQESVRLGHAAVTRSLVSITTPGA